MAWKGAKMSVSTRVLCFLYSRKELGETVTLHESLILVDVGGVSFAQCEKGIKSQDISTSAASILTFFSLKENCKATNFMDMRYEISSRESATPLRP